MNLPSLKQVTLIFGKRGSGKTFLANKLFRQEKSAVVIDFFKEYRGGIIIQDLQSFIDEYNKNPKRRFIVQIPNDEDNLLILSLVYQVGNTALYIEECSRYCDTHSIEPQLEAFTFWGRHANTSIVMIAQRPTQLNRHVLSQADTVICFQLTDSRDLLYVEQHFGKTARDNVRELGEYQYLALSY